MSLDWILRAYMAIPEAMKICFEITINWSVSIMSYYANTNGSREITIVS